MGDRRSKAALGVSSKGSRSHKTDAAFAPNVGGRRPDAERRTSVENLNEAARLRAALHTAENRFRDLVEDLRAIVWQADGGAHLLRSVSGPLEAVLGYPAERWLSERGFWVDRIHPDDRKRSLAVLRAATIEGKDGAFEHRVLAADGSVVWLAVTVRAVRHRKGRVSSIRGVMVDITERKRVEEALRESEAQLRTLVTKAPIVQFAVDGSGVVTLSEGKGLEIIGLLPSDAVGRSIFDLYRERPTDLDYFRRALAGESVAWLGSFGDVIFEYRLSPTRDRSGRVTRVVGLAIDITARKQAEETRLALERRNLEAQKLESLGLLAGGVAHDFNNLLMGIMGNASLALSYLSAASPAHDAVQQIEIAAQRSAELTRQILAYAGKSPFVAERVDLNAIVKETTRLLRISIAKRARLEYHLAGSLPAIEVDPTQVRQVLMNLVINASEAIGDADGVITVGTGLVHADRALLAEAYLGLDLPGGEYVYLDVADSGAGMDEATAARVFDPFFTTKFTGRGLGLAAVLGIVRAHKGAVSVSSAPGQGTKFRVLLPRASSTPEAAPATPAAAPPDWNGRSERDRGTVLLIDDEEDVRTVTAHMLERLGFHVLLAADGRQGIELFRTQRDVVVAVMLDMVMPGLTGEQTLEALLSIAPGARILLMSGYNEPEAMRRFAGARLAGFLQKPFRLSHLQGKLEQVLGG